MVRVTISYKRLRFSGLLHTDIHLGPYVEIDRINGDIDLDIPIRLYAEELEQFCDLSPQLTAEKECYHILEDNYLIPKSVFWVGKYNYIADVGDILRILNTKDRRKFYYTFIESKYSFRPNFEHLRPNMHLFILDREEYKKLPYHFTVQNVREVSSEYIKKKHDSYNKFWEELEEIVYTDKPIRLLTPTCNLIDNSRNRYNMYLTKILPKSTSYPIEYLVSER